ncbi:hypothetical protein [Aquicella lusitana]|uniref:CVNH domain-containing protein n=1 Tax=Aquicella lusitana TaxID=254246 RepID=A0A370GQU8_9COXI|nr:hypothetical protein [Aquicella lusitana]RDI46095.1 hypothetical protein C8D86_106103 [Aquicella lusitana]VVC73308.1 hypothetical protein AQULUS_10430 [Aquicella lusitana]
MRRIIIIGCLILILMIHTVNAADKQPVVCTNTYALCNAASCQSIPGMPDKVLCSCSIWKGKNIGFSTCEERKEKQTQDGETALVSTFSFGGSHYRYMTCPIGAPWATCLDKPCLINKQAPDTRKANCTCDVIRDQAFVTFAGECDTKNCTKTIWSGATIAGNQQLMRELTKVNDKTNLDHAACSINPNNKTGKD